MNKKITFALTALLTAGTLTACGTAEKSATPEQPAGAAASQTTPAAPSAKAPEEKDVSQNADLLKSSALNQMTPSDWDKIHLSKKDFDKFLAEMAAAKDDKSPFTKMTMPNDHTIEITVDMKEGGKLGEAMVVGVFDPLLRNVYMHSSYYKNDKQPLIRFLDTSGNVIKESSEMPKPQGTK